MRQAYCFFKLRNRANLKAAIRACAHRLRIFGIIVLAVVKPLIRPDGLGHRPFHKRELRISTHPSFHLAVSYVQSQCQQATQGFEVTLRREEH